MRNLSEYEILGLQPGASYVEIRRAYKQLAKKSHPDKIKNHQQYQNLDFKKIKQAYEALKQSETQIRKNKKLISKFSSIFSMTKNLTSDQIRQISNFLETSESSDSQDQNFFICQAIKVTNLKQMTKKLMYTKRQQNLFIQSTPFNRNSLTIQRLNKIKEELFADQSNSSQIEEQSDVEFYKAQQQFIMQEQKQYLPLQSEINEKIKKRLPIFKIEK